MKKRVIIFGATGGTGIELVKQAFSIGHSVTAFVRDKSKLNGTASMVASFKGDVLNQNDVDKAVEGHDVVLVSLGMPAKDKSTLRADGTTNIINAMNKHGVRRLICQTSLGFGDSAEFLPWHMKYIIVPYILKNAFIDHELQEQRILDSNLDWTIVRPGNMSNGRRTGKYHHGFASNAKIKLKVSRADVAEFMIQQIEDESNLHKKVGISY